MAAATINVSAPPTISTAAWRAAATLGTPYCAMLSASGGPAGTTYTFVLSSGGLPTGLALNSATGQVSGIPQPPAAVAGVYAGIVFSAVDSVGGVGSSASLTLTVACDAVSVGASQDIGCLSATTVSVTSASPGIWKALPLGPIFSPGASSLAPSVSMITQTVTLVSRFVLVFFHSQP